MKRVKSYSIADAVNDKLDQILAGNVSSKAKKTIRIDASIINDGKAAVVTMERTEFGVLITSVGDSIEKMTGVPAAALKGKYLHHLVNSTKESDLAFCDEIDEKGAAYKEQEFNGVKLIGFILPIGDGAYTEILFKK